MSGKAEEKNWGEPAKDNFDDLDRYRAKAGVRDIILILSKCYSTPRHWTGDRFANKKAFYLRCLEEGPDGACCKEFGEPKESNTAFVLHIATSNSDKWNLVGEPKKWGFSEKARSNKIYPILRDFCENDEKVLRKTMLVVTCADKQAEQFQDISILPYNGKNIKVTEQMKQAIADKKDAFIKDITIDRDSIIKSLERLNGEGGDDEVEGSAVADPAEDAGEIDIESELESIDEGLTIDEENLPF